MSCWDIYWLTLIGLVAVCAGVILLARKAYRRFVTGHW